MKTLDKRHNETEHQHHNQPIARFRSAYGPRFRLALTTPEHELPFGRTKQSFKDECDINMILKKFQRTGLIEFVNNRQPQYGDVTGFDFTEAQNLVAHGKEIFAELPSSMRKHFENDPEKFFDFVNNPANHAEGVALGLYAPPPVPNTGVPADPAKTALEPSKAV